MGIAVENGKLRISAGYSLKIPGAANYSSQDAHASYSVELDVEGDVTAIAEAAPDIYDDLETKAKLSVFKQLGLGFTEEADGTLQPKLEAAPVAAPAPAATSAPSSAPFGGGGGGQQRPFSPPKADVTQQPAFIADLGEGLIEYYDLRSLKADGTFKPRAADFRPTRKGAGNQVWLTDRDGNQNANVVAGLQAAGVAV